MSHLPKPNQNSVPDEALEAFDVEKALDKLAVVLQREIRNLTFESSRGKLGASSARDLTAYLKLLSELREQQLKELKNLTTGQLSAIVDKE